jgi:hypothetical protein
VGGEIISRLDPQRGIDIASGMIEIISCVANGNQKLYLHLFFPFRQHLVQIPIDPAF